MAKSREQVLQDQLGFLAFQLAIATADLEAVREELAALKAVQGAAKAVASLTAPAPES